MSEHASDERRGWAVATLRELSRLDELQRTTIERAYFDHQTQRQIARDLALPEPIVALSLASGLQTLACLLDPVPAFGAPAR